MMDRPARRRLINRFFVLMTALATAFALAMLVMILWSLLVQGIGGLNAAVFTETQPAPGMAGGLLNAILGSLLMCGVGMVIAVIVGVLAGTWLAEYGGGTRYADIVRFMNDVLLSAPSILIGLFVYVIMVKPFGGFSGWAGAVALGLLAMPIVTRTTEDMLNLQPQALREAGLALGAGHATVIRKIIWPSARAGLVTGALLGFARISGETAPLLFTSLGNQFVTWNMGQPMAALPTTIFQFALSAYDDWRRLAWVGALLIAFAVLSVSIIGRVLARERNQK